MILPFFIDLQITVNNRDGMWYYANSTYAAFQWRTTNQNYNPSFGKDQYDYIVEYKTSNPGSYIFTYKQLGIYLQDAEIGIQTNNGSKRVFHITRIVFTDFALANYAQFDNMSEMLVSGSKVVCVSFNPGHCVLDSCVGMGRLC